jgi:hypothetical protein
LTLTVAGAGGTVGAIISAPAAAQYGSRRCIVSDPTGTPLNVRTAPHGRIVGGLRNGTHVRLVDTAHDDQGLPWGSILDWNTGSAIGWVFRAYISCY